MITDNLRQYITNFKQVGNKSVFISVVCEITALFNSSQLIAMFFFFNKFQSISIINKIFTKCNCHYTAYNNILHICIIHNIRDLIIRYKHITLYAEPSAAYLSERGTDSIIN